METSFYEMDSRAIAPLIYAGGGGAHGGRLLMTELAMFAGHSNAMVGAGGSWPFDCFRDQKCTPAPPVSAFGVPAGPFSNECLLTGRHRIDDAAGLQLRPSTDSLNLLHINKLARTADIDG